MRRTLTKVSTIALLAVILLSGITCVGTANVDAATKKPGKPIIKAYLYSGNVVYVKWKKVSNAKKYQLYRRIGKGTWKRIKTIKAGKKKSFTYESYVKGNKRYYYKVRGLNGSKKGKFSAVKSVYFKTNPLLYKVGTTVNVAIVGGATLDNVRITNAELFDAGKRGMYEGTKDGMYFFMTTLEDGKTINQLYWGDYCDDGHNSYPDGKDENGVQHSWTFGKNGQGSSWCHGVGAWEEGIKVYYTFDGTEPQVDQEDKIGDESGYYKKQYASQVKVRGTVSYGDGLVIIGDNPIPWEENYGNNHWSLWAKVYKNDALIGEWYVFEPDC